MATINWKTGTNGSWDTAGAWTGGAVPDAGSTVIISTAGSYAIAMANAEAVGSFVLNAAGATINDSSGQVFSVGSSMTLTAGSFALSSGSQIQAAGAFKLSAGGTLQGNGGTDQITASSITLAGLTSVSSGILGLNGGGSIGGNLSGSGTLEMSSGSYALSGAAAIAGTLALLDNGATLATSTATTLTAGLQLIQGGTLSVAKAGLTLNGPLAIGQAGLNDGGNTLTGPGTLTTSGTTQINASTVPELALSGGLTWMNTGSVQDNGIGGFAGAKFVNAAGAHFAFTSDGTTLTADATPGNLFSNLGTLIKSGGTGLGVSEIDASVNSTGLIEVDTGTLTLAGGGSIAGTVSGAGTLLLINGSYGVGNATGTGHVVFGAGASVGFLVNELVATPFTFDDNVAVSVAGGATATLSGPVTIGDATGGVVLAGPGTLTTTGTTTINDAGGSTAVIDVQGGITWIVGSTGTVNDAGLGYIGTYASSGSDTSTVVNNGIFNFIGDDADLALDTRGGGGPAAAFVNTGTLAKTSGTGTSTLGATITDTGTISVASGVLALTAGGSLGGALSGAGSLALGTGAFTTGGLSGAGTLFLGSGASLTGTVTATVATSIGADAQAMLTVAAGKTLTLSGPVAIGDATGGIVLSGPGTLTTTGTTTIADAGGSTAVLDVQGGVTWVVAGTATVNDIGTGYIGTYASSGGDTSTVANNGIFNFIGDDADLFLDTRGGGGPVASFRNIGTLARTGSGTSTLGAVINDTGTISVASGVLALTAGGNVSGVLSGAGSLALGTGAFTTAGLSGAGTLFLGIGASLTGTATATIAASIGADAQATLAVAAGKTLTLSGPLAIGDDTGGIVLSGPGTLTTTGIATIADAGGATPVLDVQGGATWIVAGTATVNDAGLGYIGTYASSGGDTSTVVNNGIFNFIGDDADLFLDTRGGGGPAAGFRNTGTLARTGSGTSTIGAVITETGTINVASGVLALTAGGSLGGALSGAGSLALGTGAFTTGGLSGAGTLFLGSGASLTGTTTATIAASIGADAQAMLAVAAGKTLTLSGPVAIGDATGGIVLSGPGTLTTTGATTIADAGVSTPVLDVQGGITWIVAGAATVALSGTGYIGTYASNGSDTSSIVNNGTFALAGGDASLALDTRGGGPLAVFSNKGLLEKTGAGTSIFGAGIALTNGGTIEAAGGTFSLPGAIAGTGLLEIDAGATLEIGSVSTGQSIGFNGGAGATLQLDTPFSRALAGFTAGDRLDFATAPVSSAAVTGTTLKVVTAAGTFTYSSAGLAGFNAGVLADKTGGDFVTIDRTATASHSPEPLAFGNHHVGDSTGNTLALTVSNTAAADGYSERLNAGFSGASAGFSAMGTINAIGAGASNSTSLTAVLDTSSAGTKTGTATLSLASNGAGVDGHGVTALPAQTVNLTGAVYAYAAAQESNGGTVNLGVIHANTLATGALGLSNSAAAGGYSEALDAGLSGASAGLSISGTISGLLAGNTDAGTLMLGLTTGATGSYSGSATLNLASDGTAIGDGLGTTSLAGQTVVVLATVDNYALAAFEDPSGPALTGTSINETLDLGSVAMGGGALTATLGVLNAATGLSDLLGGTLTSAGGAGFTNSGFGSFGGLGAGQDEHAQTVSLATGTAGTFSETVVLSSYGTNASGYYGALTTETLTITGTVMASNFVTYTLDSGPNVIAGADGRGDIFVATGGSLNSRDQLTGGNGANSLTLKGAGTFDINALKVFSNIPTVNASEGQSASGTIAASVQTVLLTDIAGETLNVAAGKAAAGNTNAETIRIYGSASTDTINLAGGTDRVTLADGHDTIILGGSANSVTAGSGTALVRSTAAFANAAIVGNGAAATTLEITNAGTATLNAADTSITVRLDAAGTLKLSALSFINAIGSTGNDSLVALGGTQTLTGALGIDTLTGYTGGHDTFADTAAGLNGDTIKNWTTGDVIDLTNVASGSLHPLTFAANTLTVTDGTNSSAIKFAAGQALHDFTVLGTDGAAGTLIAYHV